MGIIRCASDCVVECGICNREVAVATLHNNNNNNNHDDIYSAVIMTRSLQHGSSGECRAAPSGRRPSDQAT